MSATATPWSRSERREVLWLALLPAFAVLVLLAGLIGFAGIALVRLQANLSGVMVLLAIAILCAYASLLLGVAPMLMLFKRLKWRSCWHYALAGYLGVVLPWFLLAGSLGLFRVRTGSSAYSIHWDSLLAILSVPGTVAAGCAALFWLMCIRNGAADSATSTVD